MSATTPPPLPTVLSGDIDTLMIDNFDSFTWNLYQLLSLLGTHVTVVRNDALTLEQLPLLRINRLIISPGPGHPRNDSGVSRDAIKYFSGKIPILGVCMGLECIVDVYGGEIGSVHLHSVFIKLIPCPLDMLVKSNMENCPPLSTILAPYSTPSRSPSRAPAIIPSLPHSFPCLLVSWSPVLHLILVS